MGKRRKLNENAPYGFQVDMFIEIDCQLICDVSGSAACSGCSNIPQSTVDYINLIFTGANTIYETEIDTHLHVLAIQLNDNYDGASSTSNALSIMRSIYATGSWTSPWHYPGTDIHHALLGKSLGGGIAYIGVLCNSEYGYGLSASLSGGFVSMSNSVVWDMKVVSTSYMQGFPSLVVVVVVLYLSSSIFHIAILCISHIIP
jgi:hypothetical protein